MRAKETESQIQKAVMRWVRYQYKIRNFVIHIPNEGKRTPTYGKMLKDMGMKKGVSDLFIAMPSRDYHGAWIEIKREKGRLTKEQEHFLELMKANGYFVSVCYGYNQTIEKIAWYCNI